MKQISSANSRIRSERFSCRGGCFLLRLWEGAAEARLKYLRVSYLVRVWEYITVCEFDLQLIKNSFVLDAEEWTRMAKGCTGGATTTGALESKETADFLDGVCEDGRAETATKDEVLRCEHDGARGVRVRTRRGTILLSCRMTMRQHCFLRDAYDLTSLPGVAVAHCTLPFVLLIPYSSHVSLVILTCTLNVCAFRSVLSGSDTKPRARRKVTIMVAERCGRQRWDLAVPRARRRVTGVRVLSPVLDLCETAVAAEVAEHSSKHHSETEQLSTIKNQKTWSKHQHI